jgi:hypothetical protein
VPLVELLVCFIRGGTGVGALAVRDSYLLFRALNGIDSVCHFHYFGFIVPHSVILLFLFRLRNIQPGEVEFLVAASSTQWMKAAKIIVGFLLPSTWLLLYSRFSAAGRFIVTADRCFNAFVGAVPHQFRYI